MIKPLTLSQVAAFCAESLSAVLHNGDCEFTQINTDTRTLVEGELFVALRGENFDAHNFLTQAANKNVCGLVVEQFDKTISLPQLVVSDSLQALGQIASMNRAAFHGTLLAITGSSGKTTVKAMLASILNECGSVHATKGNFNNHIGVPLTLMQLNAEHEFAVIEMGASAIGEIAYLCNVARPSIAMINNVMPAHIQGFGSIEGVAAAKSEIYAALPPTGTAVVNIDDELASQSSSNLSAKKILVSLSNVNADCFAKNIQFNESSVTFDLHLMNQFVAVEINALGEHSVRNALMAAAMAFAAGASLAKITLGLSHFSPVAGRMSRHIAAQGALIIDDSYNANPGSVRAAIDALSQKKGSRILVLGDLGELGSEENQLHAQLGVYAKEKNIEHLFTLGKLSKFASDAFGEQAGIHHFVVREELIAQLQKQLSPTTTLLIKGSRSAKMDLVVSALCSSGDLH
jgi:UDP-N-acetylmuramoyl-tripeptide--D-alanyl-D-alanine ligase